MGNLNAIKKCERSEAEILRQQAEDLLKQTCQNYEDLFSTIDEFYFVLDYQGNIIYTNALVNERLGYTREELFGKSVLLLHPPERRDEAGRIVSEMLSGETEFCPVPIITKSGIQIPVETRISHGIWDGKPVIFGISKDITKVKLSEEKFSKVFYLNPSACGLDDPVTGKYVEVNEAFNSLLGFEKNEVIGKTAVEMGIFTPESLNALLLKIGSLEKLTNIEADLITKNGNVKHVLLSADIIYVQDKKYRYTVVNDITERKRLEESLLFNNIILRTQQESSMDGILVVDENGSILSFNQRFADMWGIPPDVMELKSDEYALQSVMDKLANPEDYIRKVKHIYEVVNEISTDEVILKDGRTFDRYSAPMLGADGKNYGRVWYFKDITNRKMAEQAMKVSEEKYKTLLNASPDGIFLIDLNGIITEVSEIGLELFGTDSRDDLVGKSIYRFIPSDQKNSIIEIIEKTLNEGLAQNIELKLRKKNQVLFLSEISCTLIQDPVGAPLSFMIIIRDISQRKKTETKQMHADRMVNLGEMASGIAHEINQPLNIISMVMDRILFESAKKETVDLNFLKNKSSKIFENITRMRNIIDHIRAFSRDHDDYVLTAFDINSSIENAISMIAEQFKHYGICLNLKLEKQIPQLFGNTYKFEQVIINLLVNAKDAVIERKSKQEEYFEMIVEIRSYLENQFLIVEVTDNGIGISNDDINNIILPFYTTKDEGKGTGLGLSICYQIIKDMDGTIDITSNRFNGTKVRLVLDIQKQK